MLSETTTSSVSGPSEFTSEFLAFLKSDLRFFLLYMAPTMHRRLSAVEQFAVTLGLSEKETTFLKQKFFSSGLWVLKNENVTITLDFLDWGDLSVADFFSTAVQSMALLSEDGPCWFDSLIVATNAEAKKRFYRKVNAALRELMEESKQTKDENDELLVWFHSGVNAAAVHKDQWKLVWEKSAHQSEGEEL